MTQPDDDGPNLTDDDLKALVKADLHVHLVGSAAPRTVAALAARHPEGGVPARLWPKYLLKVN